MTVSCFLELQPRPLEISSIPLSSNSPYNHQVLVRPPARLYLESILFWLLPYHSPTTLTWTTPVDSILVSLSHDCIPMVSTQSIHLRSYTGLYLIPVQNLPVAPHFSQSKSKMFTMIYRQIQLAPKTLYQLKKGAQVRKMAPFYC